MAWISLKCPIQLAALCSIGTISSTGTASRHDRRRRRSSTLDRDQIKTVWLVFGQPPKTSNNRNRIANVSTGRPALYEDRTVRIDDQGVTIRHYYFPFVSKFIPYSQIESVDLGVMSWLSGRLRIWGTTDFSSWYSLDLSRPWKETAVVLTLAGRGAPSFSPKDPDRVEAEIRSRIGSHTQN